MSALSGLSGAGAAPLADSLAAPVLVPADDAKHQMMGRQLLRAAWWAILLGLAMQVIVAGATVATGGAIPGWGGQAVEAASRVTWSLLVCAGLIAGGIASSWRASRTGLAAAFAAPAAFLAAKLVGKAVAGAIKVAPPAEAALWATATIGVLKALQYGLLAMALAWLSRQEWSGLKEHVGVGVLIGAFFGGMIVLVGVFAAPTLPPTAKVIAMSANEVLFPAGCATVTFVTTFMRRHHEAG